MPDPKATQLMCLFSTMKILTATTLLVIATVSTAQDVKTSPDLPTQWPLKPLVDSDGLQSSIHSKNLLNHAEQFVKFAQISNGTRAFGSVGHNATVAYIKKLLDKTGYYDTVLQTFPYLYSSGTTQLSANGTDYTSGWFTYGPEGDVTAPIGVVNNLGCELVSVALIL